MKQAFTTIPHPGSFILWFSMTPGCRRSDFPDMALSMQSDHYFAVYTIWESAEDDAKCRGWVKDIMRDVAPSGVGAYLGDSDFEQRQTRFWGDEQAKKLMILRRKFDPRGVVCGFLDDGDQSGVSGLENREWIKDSQL